MLKKNHRLKRIDFEEVFRKGNTKSSKNFLFRTLPAENWSDFAFSVVVSKKVAKLATSRNRNKRKVYSALKETIGSMEKPLKGTIVLKRAVSDLSLKVISNEIEQALK